MRLTTRHPYDLLEIYDAVFGVRFGDFGFRCFFSESHIHKQRYDIILMGFCKANLTEVHEMIMNDIIEKHKLS